MGTNLTFKLLSATKEMDFTDKVMSFSDISRKLEDGGKIFYDNVRITVDTIVGDLSLTDYSELEIYYKDLRIFWGFLDKEKSKTNKRSKEYTIEAFDPLTQLKEEPYCILLEQNMKKKIYKLVAHTFNIINADNLIDGYHTVHCSVIDNEQCELWLDGGAKLLYDKNSFKDSWLTNEWGGKVKLEEELANYPYPINIYISSKEKEKGWVSDDYKIYVKNNMVYQPPLFVNIEKAIKEIAEENRYTGYKYRGVDKTEIIKIVNETEYKNLFYYYTSGEDIAYSLMRDGNILIHRLLMCTRTGADDKKHIIFLSKRGTGNWEEIFNMSFSRIRVPSDSDSGFYLCRAPQFKISRTKNLSTGEVYFVAWLLGSWHNDWHWGYKAKWLRSWWSKLPGNNFNDVQGLKCYMSLNYESLPDWIKFSHAVNIDAESCNLLLDGTTYSFQHQGEYKEIENAPGNFDIEKQIPNCLFFYDPIMQEIYAKKEEDFKDGIFSTRSQIFRNFYSRNIPFNLQVNSVWQVAMSEGWEDDIEKKWRSDPVVAQNQVGGLAVDIGREEFFGCFSAPVQIEDGISTQKFVMFGDRLLLTWQNKLFRIEEGMGEIATNTYAKQVTPMGIIVGDGKSRLVSPNILGCMQGMRRIYGEIEPTSEYPYKCSYDPFSDTMCFIIPLPSGKNCVKIATNFFKNYIWIDNFDNFSSMLAVLDFLRQFNSAILYTDMKDKKLSLIGKEILADETPIELQDVLDEDYILEDWGETVTGVKIMIRGKDFLKGNPSGRVKEIKNALPHNSALYWLWQDCLDKTYDFYSQTRERVINLRARLELNTGLEPGKIFSFNGKKWLCESLVTDLEREEIEVEGLEMI